MKKIVVALCVMMLFGCAGVSIQTDQTAAMKAAGQALGIAIAANNPGMISTAAPYVMGLLATAKDGKIDDASIAQAIALIPGDAQTKLALSLALSFVTVEIKTGTKNDQVVAILEGVSAGLQGVK